MSPGKSPSHGKHRRTLKGDESTVRALHESEERYRLLVEHAPLGILTCDRAGNILTINQKVLDLMGSVSSEFTRSVNVLSFPPLMEAGISGDVAACLATGKPVANECYYVSQWGKKIYLRYNLAPIQDASGDIVGVQGFLEDVAERKLAAEALRESEEHFRTLAETAPVAICILQDGRLRYINPAMETISGYTKEELQSLDFKALIHPDALEYIKKRYGEWLGGASGEARYELKGIRKDGEVRWADVSRKTIDYAGKPALLLTGIDVTERKRAEMALRASEEKYRNLAENINDWVWEIDENGRYTYASPRVQDLLGFEPGEMIGRSPFDFMTAGEAKRVRGIFEPIFRLREPFSLLENRLTRKGGGEVIVETSGLPVFDDRGRFAGYRGIDRDITSRKQAEKALRDSEERLRLCAATARLGTFDWDLVNDRHVWSTETYEIYGLLPGTHLNGEMLTDLIYPGDRLDSDLEAGLDPLGTGEYAMEYRIVRASDGAVRWVYLVTRVIFEGEGAARKAVRVLGVVQDITERKRAEEALRESEEKFRALAETTNAGIMLYRGERFIYLNPVLEKISGYTSEELLRMKFWELVHPDHLDLVRDRGMARQRGRPVPSSYEAKIIARDGKEKWLEFSAGLINYAGEPTGIATLYDITERKRVEEALAEAKATAELYLDLMGHDINNMNQVSMGFMEMARHKMEFEGKLTMDDVYLVDKAIESVRNSSNLIRNVRKLQRAKLGMYEPEVIDLGKMLIEVAAQNGDVPGRQVRINCAAKTGCYVKANELLRDVFINLVGNAIKHSRGPLDINIQMNETHVDGQAYWKVIVDDNGPGIPDSQKQTLFGRLNLSVSRARGKGFGLCLIKLLIDGYRGEFRVEDRVSGDHTKGARFVVMLPAVPPVKP